MGDETYYVEIVRDSDGFVAKRMGPMGIRRARSVRAGAEINLDYVRWSVRIVDENGKVARDED